ncbi:hypothetical protein GW17_00029354 [Ensete ventricosum]|nr:hypothetical protein GW17_00029354 [Ensete ventricosum]
MSFSSDFNMQPPPARTPGPPPDPDFEFSVGSHPMMAADQLFFKGRLLPLKDNHQRGGHRITTLRDELRANGSGERLPKGPVKWRGLLGLRKTAAKKGDKKEDELLGKSSQVGITLTMLLTGKSFFRRIHYEVLSVKEHASYDEIRASYKTAILNSHPDKLKKKSEAFTDHQQDFLDVQKAWEVLSDSTSRANYDKELQLMRQELEVPANEIELGDMSVESVGDFEEFFYECRCGDYFSITWSELKEFGIILDKETIQVHSSTVSLPASVLIPCGSCSLKVRLTIDRSS